MMPSRSPIDSGVQISDSVVMGDVQQNITTIHQSDNSCPSCGTSGNIRIMVCKTTDCGNKFCDFCHPDCRFRIISSKRQAQYRMGHAYQFTPKTERYRFDSNEGDGPCCEECIASERKKEMKRIRKEKRKGADNVVKTGEATER